jgi:hypothetical protein
MTFPITGQATYSFADLRSAAFWGRARWTWLIYVGALAAVFGYDAWITGIEDVEDLLRIFLVPLILLPLAIVAFFVMLGFVSWRMGADQRRITYEIDDAQIKFSDGTGATTSFPWQRVKAWREHGSGIAIFLKPMGACWLIKRAFAAADLEALRALARSMVAKP